MNVARVKDGVVVNFEVVDRAWLDANNDAGVKFVPYSDESPAHLGLGYTEIEGFEQPPVEAT